MAALEKTRPDVKPAGDRRRIVSLEEWQSERDSRTTARGVRLAVDQPPSLIAADLDRLDVVVLTFPRFNDGRPFSYARQLRQKFCYAGEILADGPLLKDQYGHARRCGFDGLANADAAALAEWRAQARAFAHHYQPDATGQAPIPALRGRAKRKTPATTDRGADESAASAGDVNCAAYWAY